LRPTGRASICLQDEIRRRNENERIAYDGYRRQAVDSVFDGLPEDERRGIEDTARQAITGSKGPLYDTMLRVKRRQLVAQRYHDRIRPFAEWRTARHAESD
jgi:hypothetical protein